MALLGAKVNLVTVLFVIATGRDDFCQSDKSEKSHLPLEPRFHPVMLQCCALLPAPLAVYWLLH